MVYPFKLWGFGEDIGLRGLWESSTVLGDQQYHDFVLSLLANWTKHHDPLKPKDHVAPGVPLLLAYEKTGEAHYLSTALELAALLENAKVVAEIPVHRHELEPWNHHVWVDCIYMDAPFLVRLWHKHPSINFCVYFEAVVEVRYEANQAQPKRA